MNGGHIMDTIEPFDSDLRSWFQQLASCEPPGIEPWLKASEGLHMLNLAVSFLGKCL